MSERFLGDCGDCGDSIHHGSRRGIVIDRCTLKRKNVINNAQLTLVISEVQDDKNTRPNNQDTDFEEKSTNPERIEEKRIRTGPK
jgi:hypothetical protein